MSVGTLETRLDNVKKFWGMYNVYVTAIEIDKRSDLPEWEDCGKREIYVGVKRRESGDLVYVIKHRFEAEFELSVPVEELDFIKEWFMMTGPLKNQVCSICNEESTSIDIYEVCHDCK